MRRHSFQVGIVLAPLLAARGSNPPAGSSFIPGHIAFVSDRTGGRQIFVIQPDGSG